MRRLIKCPSPTEVFEIKELNIYPLRFAPGMKEILYERGMKFWECRYRNYVCYNGWDYNHDQEIVCLPSFNHYCYIRVVSTDFWSKA